MPWTSVRRRSAGRRQRRRRRVLHGRRPGPGAGHPASRRRRRLRRRSTGVIPWPDAQPDYSKMTAAVLAHIAELDELFSPERPARSKQQLRGPRQDVEFHVYEGADHAFFNDTRPEVYDAAASTAGVGTHHRLPPRPPRVTRRRPTSRRVPSSATSSSASPSAATSTDWSTPTTGRPALAAARRGRPRRRPTTGRRGPGPDRRPRRRRAPRRGHRHRRRRADRSTAGRRRWLRAQVVGLLTTARRLAGEPIGYAEEVESCYGVRPDPGARGRTSPPPTAASPRCFPGTGPLAERSSPGANRTPSPPTACPRPSTRWPTTCASGPTQLFGLPDGEHVDFELVTDKPWSGFNNYLGDLRSPVAINTDLPGAVHSRWPISSPTRPTRASHRALPQGGRPGPAPALAGGDASSSSAPPSA